jgi:transcriptional regulator with GAF, ATPase, and Fis domain
MEDLMQRVQETCYLCVADQGQCLYIEKVECSQPIRIIHQVGQRTPLYCTGVGKALMSGMTDEGIDRLIAATNGDLPAAVAAGKFREDLFYRLSGITLTLPPLRARRDEVPELAEGFLRRLDPDRPWTLAVAARRRLVATDLAWPGNLRQLELAMHRARDRAALADPDGTVIDVVHVDGATRPGPVAAADPGLAGGWQALAAERQRLDDRERELIRRALDQHHAVVARAAAELGVSRTSLVSRLRTLGIADRG